LKEEKIERLMSLITDVEYQALIKRIDDLLDAKAFPRPSDEWPAIPWPAF
jgi:hypothetical protein